MTIAVSMTNAEAVFTASAIVGKVEKLREFLVETDHKFGEHNTVQRMAIRELKSAHVRLLAALRAEGYPMKDEDIVEKEGDTKVGGNFFEPSELEVQ